MSGLGGLGSGPDRTGVALLVGLGALAGFLLGTAVGPLVEVDVITTPVGCSACGS